LNLIYRLSFTKLIAAILCGYFFCFSWFYPKRLVFNYAFGYALLFVNFFKNYYFLNLNKSLRKRFVNKKNILLCSSYENGFVENNNSGGMDVTCVVHPGIYEIRDLETNLSYYGETDSLVHRLDSHRQLRKGTHENTNLRKRLQDNPDLKNIRFIILHSGPEWADVEKRKKCEDDYIAANAERCYNVINPPTQKRSRKNVMANGKLYTSDRKAAIGEKFSRASIVRFCEDPSNKDYYYVVQQVEVDPGSVPIFGQKGESPSLFFRSYTECIEAGFATNHQNARRKIQRKQPGWRYAHVDANGNPLRDKDGRHLRKAYQLKPGEISYVDWKEQQNSE